MSRFLLIRNKSFYKKHNIYCLGNTKDAIPEENCILFLGSHGKPVHTAKRAFSFFEHIRRKSQYKYIVIVGKGDGNPCEIIKMVQDKQSTIPENIINIYATHTNFDHPIIKYLPLGSDFRSIDSFHKGDPTNTNRDILCYCNFSTNTHGCRLKIYNILKNFNHISIESMKTFLRYSISRDEFFERLSRSKFVICPKGFNLDSYRFWDTLYSGAIPIVVKQQFHNLDLFKNLPILFLNDVEEHNLLTEDFLNKKYEELKPRIKHSYEELDFDAFIENMKNDLKINS